MHNSVTRCIYLDANPDFDNLQALQKLKFYAGGIGYKVGHKTPGDLITTHFRGNLKIVGPYNHSCKFYSCILLNLKQGLEIFIMWLHELDY